MGKGIMLLVVAMLLTGAVLLNNARRSSLESHKRQAKYEDEVIATEIARTGLEIAISKVKKDFENWRSGFSNVEYLGGAYTVTVTGPPEGPVVITSTGTMNQASRTLKITLTKTAFAFDAALIVHASSISPSFTGNSFLISGFNEQPPSESSGSVRGPSTHAVKVVSSVLESEFKSAISPLVADNIVGVGGDADVVSDPLQLDVPALYQEALSKVEASNVYPGGQYTGNQVFGSPEQPGVFVFQGNTVFTGNIKGYGILVVDGDLSIGIGNFTWEGIVLLHHEGDTEVTLTGNAKVYGAVIIYVEEGEEELSFDIDAGKVVPGTSFAASVEVLGAAISYGGQYAMPVTAAVQIGNDLYEPWGAYTNPEQGNVNADAGSNPHPALYTIPESYPENVPITVKGMAWRKKWKRKRGRWIQSWVPYREIDSKNGDIYVKPLRNGDPVPKISGYLGQASIEDFIAPYIDDTGHVVLADNQVIYLFELGVTNLNSAAADFQDLVVLVTLSKSNEGSISEDRSSDSTSGGNVVLTFGGNARIVYSASAIQRLLPLVSALHGVTS